MIETETRAQVPPYVPYRTFTAFLDTLKTVGMPSHIDKATMGTMSGGNQSWLKAAMRYMKLIDAEGVPSDLLKMLVNADAESRKRILNQLFKATYAAVLAKIDLQNTTPTKLRAAVVEMGGQGETAVKNVAFLIAMAKDAGVSLSPYLLKRAAPVRRTKPTRAIHIRPENGDESDDDDDNGGAQAQQLTPEQMLLDLLNPDAMEEAEKQAVWTLLLYLKKQTK